MVDLITRYKPRNKSHCEWRLPPPTRDCLNKHFISHTERFANPLTAPDACTPYWSDHERDRVFGAHTGRYKYQWTGFSHALLPADAPATDKAIHWALWSATHTSKPTATILSIPKGLKTPGTPAFKRWTKDYPNHVPRPHTEQASDHTAPARYSIVMPCMEHGGLRMSLRHPPQRHQRPDPTIPFVNVSPSHQRRHGPVTNYPPPPTS